MKIEKVNIGYAIEHRLNELEVSKAEFGRRIGIPQQNVNRVLNKTSIDTKKLVAISEALDYNFFAEFVDEEQETPRINSIIHTMESINDRIEQVVNERFGGNKAAFAKSIDMAPTSMSTYLSKKRRSKPSVDMVAKIVQKLGVDASWLLLGEKTLQVLTNCSNDSKDAKDANCNDNQDNIVALKERVRLLEALLEEKERVIRLYEKFERA